MNPIFALMGLLALVAILVYLARLVAHDGYGSIPPPRSHSEELGSWIEQQLHL